MAIGDAEVGYIATNGSPSGWNVSQIGPPTEISPGDYAPGQCTVSTSAGMAIEGTGVTINYNGGVGTYGGTFLVESGIEVCIENGKCCSSSATCQCDPLAEAGPDAGGNLTAGSGPPFGLSAYSGGSSTPGQAERLCFRTTCSQAREFSVPADSEGMK